MTPERFDQIHRLERKWAEGRGSKWVEFYTAITCSHGKRRQQLLAQVAKAIGIPVDEFREWYNEFIDQTTAFDVPPEEKSEAELRDIVFDSDECLP